MFGLNLKKKNSQIDSTEMQLFVLLKHDLKFKLKKS